MTVKRKIYITVSWLLTAACMGFIFYMSSRAADESSAMSDSVIQKIFDLIGVEFSSFAIRKAAHMCEFAGLSALIFNAVYATWELKLTPLIAFSATVLYAVSDEIHQIFVEGRACQLRDVLIDSTGALIGITASFIILKIIERGRNNGNIKTL